MKTTHQIIFENAKNMRSIASNSVDLIVTSPPYPMIKMWDEMFAETNPEIREALSLNQGSKAFELMHRALEPVWDEVYRILKKGSIACVNIGDATRTIGGNFKLYSNHSRILTYLHKLGFSALPAILWRKQTNAPNKFMGSGMLPPGAYITLEHEFILILRKGPKREFKATDEKLIRRGSAFFWEERNVWFSDIWLDLKGTTQNLNDKKMRLRSAAYPFELPYRLINMFSVKNDLVVDPFLGVATTILAAMAAGRNSIGYEIDNSVRDAIFEKTEIVLSLSNQRIRDRIRDHLEFVRKRTKEKGPLKHKNKHYGFPVMTSQEKELLLNQLQSVKRVNETSLEIHYSDEPQGEFCRKSTEMGQELPWQL
jgi:DNA modification methylase